MIDFRSASVTHPIFNVSGMSKRGVKAVLGHKYGYLQKSSKRLVPMKQDGDGDGDVEEPPEDAGVDDDDEGEDAVATEMRGPDESTNAMRKHQTHKPTFHFKHGVNNA